MRMRHMTTAKVSTEMRRAQQKWIADIQFSGKSFGSIILLDPIKRSDKYNDWANILSNGKKSKPNSILIVDRQKPWTRDNAWSATRMRLCK